MSTIPERLKNALGVDTTNSQVRYAAVLRQLLRPGICWLDVGCGRQIVPPWVASAEEQANWVAPVGKLVGLDLDAAMKEHPFLHGAVHGSVERLPFAAESFDLVSMNMVAEHLAAPDIALREIFRILKPGGKLVAHTSNYQYYLIFIASLIPDKLKKKLVWWLERRAEEDVFPAYYRINTHSAVKLFAAKTAFEVSEIIVGGSNGTFQNIPLLNVIEIFILRLLASDVLKNFRATITFTLIKASSVPRSD